MIGKKQKENAQAAAPQALAAQYNAFIGRGDIKDDPAQRQVLQALQTLIGQLSPTSQGLGRFFKKTEAVAEPKGIYIWGNVGRGKSMLMDLFYQHAPVAKKRRVHFHAFMQEVHTRIHQFRLEGARGKSGADPVVMLYQQIAEETQLLCFDELQATDVADASLLYRLFEGLFDAGVIIVSTSNHPPTSLYTGGVQKERFDKFIALIEERMYVESLDSNQDYRQIQGHAGEESYVYPLGAKVDAFIAQVIATHCANTQPKKGTMHVQGRAIAFQLYDTAVGRFSFRDLCETALGPADYLMLAKRLKILILTDIPKLPAEKRNEAKRFVTLIDALYEYKVKLFATAEVAPSAIYSEGDGSFEFHRTVSRLTEMQSAKWMKND